MYLKKTPVSHCWVWCNALPWFSVPLIIHKPSLEAFGFQSNEILSQPERSLSGT